MDLLESPTSEPGSKPITRRSPRLVVRSRTPSTPSASDSTGQRWYAWGSCSGLGQQVFYGTSDHQPMSRPEITRAKSVCAECPVRRRCLQYSLEEREDWGIWGGYTRAERDRALMEFKTIPLVLYALDEGLLDTKVVL